MLLQSYLVDIHKFMNNIIWRLKYFYNWGKNNLNFRRTGMFSFPLNLSNTFCKYFINSWNMKEKVKEYFNCFHQYNYEQFQYYVLFESAVNLQNWTTFLWISNVCISLSFRWQMILKWKAFKKKCLVPGLKRWPRSKQIHIRSNLPI